MTTLEKLIYNLELDIDTARLQLEALEERGLDHTKDYFYWSGVQNQARLTLGLVLQLK